MFFQLQKSKRYKESEEIFSKFLLPIHQRFSNHLAIFKQFPCLTLETKIILYSIKILKNLEDAKKLKNYYLNRAKLLKLYEYLGDEKNVNPRQILERSIPELYVSVNHEAPEAPKTKNTLK